MCHHAFTWEDRGWTVVGNVWRLCVRAGETVIRMMDLEYEAEMTVKRCGSRAELRESVFARSNGEVARCNGEVARSNGEEKHVDVIVE
jgi:hypothetical protein